MHLISSKPSPSVTVIATVCEVVPSATIGSELTKGKFVTKGGLALKTTGVPDKSKTKTKMYLILLAVLVASNIPSPIY
jgi:hypothetical protein